MPKVAVGNSSKSRKRGSKSKDKRSKSKEKEKRRRRSPKGKDTNDLTDLSFEELRKRLALLLDSTERLRDRRAKEEEQLEKQKAIQQILDSVAFVPGDRGGQDNGLGGRALMVDKFVECDGLHMDKQDGLGKYVI